MEPAAKPAGGQLTPIAACSSSQLPAEGTRQHVNRPSRLSAVLIPAPTSAAPTASSPKSPSGPSAAAPRPGVPPKSPGSDVPCTLEKQDPTCIGLTPCMPARCTLPSKVPGVPPAKSCTPALVSPPGASTTTCKASTATTAPASAAVPAPGKVSAPAAAAAGHSPFLRPGPAGARTTSGAMSAVSSADSSMDESGWDLGWQTASPWYCKPRKVAVVLLLLASLGLVLAGLVLQVVMGDPEDSNAEVYPWLYFFAAFSPLALALRWLCWRLYMVAEYTAIREELYFLRPLRTKLASVLFWMIVLLWFQACFNWLWCQGMCEEQGVKKALLVVWRLLICVTLFSAANFLKCGIARLLSYSFYRTAHFEKVKDAIERELYLIRLSQARSALLPTSAAPLEQLEQPEAADMQQQQRRPGGWGSTVWRRTSQVFLGQHISTAAPAEEPAEGGSPAKPTPQFGPAHAGAKQVGGSDTAPAASLGGKSTQDPFRSSALQAVSSADRVVEDAAVHVQVHHLSEAVLKHHQSQQAQTVGASAIRAAGPQPEDCSPLLQQQPLSCPAATPRVTWLQPDGQKAQPKHAQQQQHHQQQQPPSDQPGRQQSYELFAADRVPSILGMPGGQGPHQRSSRTGSKAGSRVGQQLTRARVGSSRASTSSARHVALAGLVAGVDGLLLQPEALGTTTTADGQASRKAGQPMSEEELSELRLRLGVNTFGTFVDRYYGMTPKEEAAHVRQVKKFAKGLFANVLGDAERDHILPCDFLLFFDGDEGSAHDAFAYFDRNGDGSISCSELQESAAEMLCERKNIAASIKDTDSVVNSLETGLGMLIHFTFIALYLLVFGVNIVQGFTTFSATALALTFVFGDSVKGVFESALFLFVEHVYDVGDALWLPGGVLARVKKIDLQFTVLLRSDGQLVWHPNSTLRLAPLVNLSRSNPRWEGYTLLVDIDTPEEVLTQLESALAVHVAKHRAHFRSNPAVTWRALEEPLKMRLAVGVTYNFTGEDAGRYVSARHGILSVIRHELHRMQVKYTVPLQQQTLMPLQQQQQQTLTSLQ